MKSREPLLKVISPMVSGNGAHVIHSNLAKNIKGYEIDSYNPYWTIYPPLLRMLESKYLNSADLIHTTPDYAHYFNPVGKSLIITFHNYVLDTFMNKYSSIAQRIYYTLFLKQLTLKALDSATAVTAVSKFTANLIKDDLACEKTIKIIYNGIDTQAFLPMQKNKSQHKIKVLFSGNLTRRKGAHLMQKIADRLNEGIEILYTSGLRSKKRLPRHARLKNIGSIKHTDMPAIYQEADILLFPTLREGFGLAAVEAMACGIPVIATNCSSLPEIVDNAKGGFLCQPENVNEFAEKINILADSPTLRIEMGEYNRSEVEKRFTIEKMVNQYKDLFNKLSDNFTT